MDKHKMTAINIINKSLKYIFIIAIALAISVYYAVSSIDIKEATQSGEKLVSEFLGKETKVNGNVRVGIRGLSPYILLGDVTIKNSPNSKYENLLSANRIVINISIPHLFIGELKASRIFIASPEINYDETGGKSNFDFAFLKKGNVDAEKKENGIDVEYKKFLPINIVLSNIYIKDMTIRIKTDTQEKKYSINAFRSTLELGSIKTKLLVQIYQGDKTYGLNIDASPLHDILNKKEDLYFNSEANWDKSNFVMESTVKDLGNLAGFNINAKGSIENIKELLANLNISYIEMPQINFNVQASGSIDNINIKSAKFTILDSSLSVTGTVKNITKARHNADLKINAGVINLPKIFAYENYDYSKHASKQTPAYIKEGRDPKVFTGVEFPIDLINQWDVNLKLSADKIMPMSTMPIENVDIDINLKNGIAYANPISAKFAGGAAEVLLKADASSKKYLDATLMITGQNIKVGKVLEYSDAGKILDDKGLAQVSIFFKGKGANLSALVGSLNGEVKLNSITEFKGYDLSEYAVGKDVILNLWEKIVNSEKSKDLKIYCFAANLQAHDGISESNKEIAIQTDQVNIVANGIIDFKKETLDVSIVPVPISSVAGIDTSDLVSMIMVKGPIAEPSIAISGEQLAKTATKLAIPTAIAGFVSGGTLLLPALGISYLANNWLNSAMKDPNPCETASKRTHAKETVDYSHERSEFLAELRKSSSLKVQENIETKKDKSVFEKVGNEVIVKPISGIVNFFGAIF
ncbi:MAG: AsmA family protein [Rickettsiales bacterium]|jgi:uncharacterized protein involved in outer membrane biogenesis|nr:AsmA family protein [Rickettsiales bacterium]